MAKRKSSPKTPLESLSTIVRELERLDAKREKLLRDMQLHMQSVVGAAGEVPLPKRAARRTARKTGGKKRKISKAGREAIAAAARKRWAKVRAEKKKQK